VQKGKAALRRTSDEILVYALAETFDVGCMHKKFAGI
jgi:hypothetical protein